MDTPKLKSYQVPYSHKTNWQTVTELADFVYPWEASSPPRIVFKAFRDDTWLYCQFEVTDTDVKVFVIDNTKEEVLLGDRVEIFFKQDEKMDPYYCLEIDFLGRVYDYRASWYRKFEPQWSWPAGQLKVEAQRTPQGYTVMAAISLTSLEELELLKSDELLAGLFRGKCVSRGNMKWISWITPTAEEPDFHIPSAFGVLKLGAVDST